MTNRAGGVPTPRAAFHALTRTFLRRFFDNEITGGTDDTRTSFFWLIAFLAAPMTLLPVSAMISYRMIVLKYGGEALRLLSRPHKTFVITLGMTAAALIAAVVWNSLMLDRRDGLILGTLPIRGRTIVLSKSCLAYDVFIAAVHGVSSVLSGMRRRGATSIRAASWLGCALHRDRVGRLRLPCVTAAQGLALTLAGRPASARVSPILQVASCAPSSSASRRWARSSMASRAQPTEEQFASGWLAAARATGVVPDCCGGFSAALDQCSALPHGRHRVHRGNIVTSARMWVWRDGAPGAPEWVRPAPRDALRVVTRRLSRLPAAARRAILFVSIGRVERLRFVVAVTLRTRRRLDRAGCRSSPPAATAQQHLATSRLTPRSPLDGLRVAISMPADLRGLGPPRSILRCASDPDCGALFFAGSTVTIALRDRHLAVALRALLHGLVMSPACCRTGAVALNDRRAAGRRPEHALALWWRSSRAYDADGNVVQLGGPTSLRRKALCWRPSLSSWRSPCASLTTARIRRRRSTSDIREPTADAQAQLMPSKDVRNAIIACNHVPTRRRYCARIGARAARRIAPTHGARPVPGFGIRTRASCSSAARRRPMARTALDAS